MDAAWEAVRMAKLPRVHIFLATSEIHMQYKLKMTPDQVNKNPLCLSLSLWSPQGIPSIAQGPVHFSSDEQRDT